MFLILPVVISAFRDVPGVVTAAEVSERVVAAFESISAVNIQSYTLHITVCLKTMHFTVNHNFCKCRPIFKIVSLPDSRRNCLCNCYWVYTSQL